jgi:hypothetical protein
MLLCFVSKIRASSIVFGCSPAKEIKGERKKAIPSEVTCKLLHPTS